MQARLKLEKIRSLIRSEDHNDLQKAGISNVVCLIEEGGYGRRLPVYLDLTAADGHFREEFQNFNNQTAQYFAPLHIMEMNNCVLVGQGCVITADNRVVFETIDVFINNGLSPDGILTDSCGNYVLEGAESRTVPGKSLLLKRPWYQNFGHWLIECASLLALLHLAIKKQGWSITIGYVSDPALRRIIFETLNRFCPDSIVYEHRDHEIWRCDGLLYSTPIHAPPNCKNPFALSALRNSLMAQPTNCRRRIFISRRDQNTRRLVNESEIFDILNRNFIEIVSLVGMSLADQVKLFQQCEVVIGVKGAGLSNILFCREQTKILILSPSDFPDPFYSDIASQLNLAFGECVGPVVPGRAAGLNDFWLDPEGFQKALNAMAIRISRQANA